ncbi:hypothetical protein BCR44DRAFT_44936 [Catenaria anguillulae PL171]|uniref:Transcription initiation factor TFIID subunit 13 n=1 Tax=Catenaria anguillulae PL171 TaxID=765915 RepID=A0A1Y2HZD7_9FUNG|nr:hypothetical protein BCR44DRAFT_44936 [Catenaria anguillulae PL171]
MERTASKKTAGKANSKADAADSGGRGKKGGDTGRQSRAEIVSKYKGTFNDELSEMLYSHGDPKDVPPDPATLDLLDDMLLEFLYDTAQHAHRYAPAKSRIKVDDLRMTFRHDPNLLGRMEEILEKDKKIHNARKSMVTNSDLASLALLAEEHGGLDEGGDGGGEPMGGADEEQLNRMLGAFSGAGAGLDALLGGSGLRGLSALGKEDEEVDLSEPSAASAKQRKRKAAAAGDKEPGSQPKKSRTTSPQKKPAATAAAAGASKVVSGETAGSHTAGSDLDGDGDDDMEDVGAKEPAPPAILDPVLAAILGGF